MDLPLSGGSREDDHVSLQLPAVKNFSTMEFSDVHSSMAQLEVAVFPEQSHLGADLTYYHKTTGMNARKKNWFSFNITVPFGKISYMDGPSKPISTRSALPLSKAWTADPLHNFPMPSYLSSTSHEENQGELHLGVNMNNISGKNT